jgi:hypothetical protein
LWSDRATEEYPADVNPDSRPRAQLVHAEREQWIRHGTALRGDGSFSVLSDIHRAPDAVSVGYTVQPFAGVDLRCPDAELGRVNAGLDLELLERVDRRLNDVRVEVRVGVLDAIERVAIELEALAGDRERGLGACASLQSAAAPGSALRGHIGA